MKYILSKQTNTEVKKSLIEIAKNQGLRVCDVYEREIDSWEFMLNDDSNIDWHILGVKKEATHGIKILSPGQMMDKILKVKPTINIRLNNDYEAIIDIEKGIVEVGCQKIPFDAVEAVFHAINKHI